MLFDLENIEKVLSYGFAWGVEQGAKALVMTRPCWKKGLYERYYKLAPFFNTVTPKVLCQTKVS